MATSGLQKTRFRASAMSVGIKLTITPKAEGTPITDVVPFVKGMAQKGMIEGAMSMMGALE